jgi:5-formyltetrahydrofolate cyclo-ligase
MYTLKTKETLRIVLAERRRRLDPQLRLVSAGVICEQLILSINWDTTRSLHCYIPLVSKAEVSTWPFLQYVWQTHPDVQTYAPGPLQLGRPTAHLIDASTRWEKTNKIPPPSDTKLAPVTDFDLIIVPMLGFDASLHRLGYGGGYYDRLLAVRRVPTIGLCFADGFMPDGIPHEPHDIPLSVIITEKKIYR